MGFYLNKFILRAVVVFLHTLKMEEPFQAPQNGVKKHKHKHKNREHKRNKYVLGPDGKPLVGPDGHRVRIKKEIKQEVSNGDYTQSTSRASIEGVDLKHVKAEPDGDMKLKQPKKEKAAKRRSAGDAQGGPKSKVKKEEPDNKWKWWEESSGSDKKKEEGVKWNVLEHKGPVFAPDYVCLPSHIKMKYKGKPVDLSETTEEIMTFYARMLNHEYVLKEDFNRNFFGDWRKEMTLDEKKMIKDLQECDFKDVFEHFQLKSEERKARSKEEKQAEKRKTEKLVEEYGFCNWDGHKEKIGNFKLEPPGLFRGRGEHPKMGKLKKRIRPEDVIINCSRGSTIPAAPQGHKWKEIRHDNTVTWLVTWTENIQGQNKYIMLNPNSRIKGEKDWQKYEVARNLKTEVDLIRSKYLVDLKSPQMVLRQRAVALYFVDKLALRAGNEKDGDESADTVGCCSLRCEHIKLHKHFDDKDYVVEMDFLGKDSIRYYNKVAVLKQVFKNLNLFIENKKGPDDLFDRLNTSMMNKYLQSLMPGLTAKVFRTYNASFTLQNQLNEMSKDCELFKMFYSK